MLQACVGPDGLIVVVDVITGSRWVPSRILQDAIHHAPNPSQFAVAMCRSFGEMGEWIL